MVQTAQPDAQASERKALLFSAGGIRFALRLNHIREILPATDGGPEISVRGESVSALPVALSLGLPVMRTNFALLIEATPPVALRVDELFGIIELAQAQVFQLPLRTSLPAPPPFLSAIVHKGELALEISPVTLGWAPIEPPPEIASARPEQVAGPDRELVFERAYTHYAVPIPLVVQVIDAPQICPVPLTPSAHLGLMYHGKALHPVFDVEILFGQSAGVVAQTSPVVLLIEAGGTAIGVVADRVLGVGERLIAENALRPSWDALFMG